MKQQEFIKILIKKQYESKEDLVSRPLIRIFQKLNYFDVFEFANEKGIYLYGYRLNGKIYELFTNQIIGNDTLIKSETTTNDEVLEVMKKLDESKLLMIYLLMKKYVFGEEANIDFTHESTIEEKAEDRRILFNNYNDGLTDINPYDKENINEYDKSIVQKMYRK